jgi:CHASE2 domain-containing sensor protein
MESLLSSLALTVFIGVLAFVAQWSRKNRMAEISLVVVLAFISLLLLATGALLSGVWIWGQAPPKFQQLLAVSSLPIAAFLDEPTRIFWPVDVRHRVAIQ